MNAETLEALLIDRALGQLSPEVEVLLTEHLAIHPEAAPTAAALAGTVALASSLLKQPAPRLPLPPRAVAVFPPPRKRRLLPLAASFVAGAGASFFALRSTAPQPATPLAQAPAPAVVVAQAAPPRRVEIDPAVALASAKPSVR